MRERGKAVEAYNFADFNYPSSDMPCKKHPSSSSVGICAFCLKDRLAKLVCSECGEQRLSSCSCSDISSYRNSSCTADVGSVGRMSFLIENDKSKSKKSEIDKADEVILLRRSASSCVEVKKYKGFWKIKRLFRKKKEKGFDQNGGFDDKSEVWVSDIMGVSRSRSLCSFRNGGFNDTDDGGSDYRFSSAKISDVTGGILFDYDKQCGGGFSESEPRRSGFRGFSDNSEPRKSGFRGLIDDSEPRKSGFKGLIDDSEPRKSGFRGLMDDSEPRKSGFRGVTEAENGTDLKNLKKIGGPMELERTYSVPNRSIFPVKESDFNAMDESAFIDLKLDLSSSESTRPSEFAAAVKINEEGSSENGNFLKNNEGNFEAKIPLKHSGSCRITVNDRALKRGTNSYKIWKWFSRYHSGGGRRTSKKDENSGDFIKS
ncbi:hypothetical protein M9H77_09698 [Catharanthus roseus]|uniref:Uncharacterized protein n=1 Tax=Catharanthus roseus TaxID=4058 RepID=A0ACC0C1X4_CATRO|nr:hypothetical protein M9H77_09698 [Catharanthus roseus]